MSSSGESDHAVKRVFIKDSPGANSFKVDFGDFADALVLNETIIFNVIPLNEKDEQITPDLSITVVSSKDSKVCNSIGGSTTHFSKLELHQQPRTVETTPAIPCKGYWEVKNKCVSANNICDEEGTRSEVWVTEEPAQGGGTCPSGSRNFGCYMSPSDGCVRNPDPTAKLPHCTQGPRVGIADEEKINEIAKNPSYVTGDFDKKEITKLHQIKKSDGGFVGQKLCTKPWLTSDTEKPGFFATSRYVQNINASTIEKDCGLKNAIYEVYKCNDFLEPKPCKAGNVYDRSRTPITKTCKKGEINSNGHNVYREYKKMFIPQIWSVITPKQGDGANCENLGRKSWETKEVLTSGDSTWRCGGRFGKEGICADTIPRCDDLTAPPI